ncbi:ISNCY family transposase [Pseudomaricurvus alcaniphilus]|uniref:ISNCY family transposase n=1 Tax=Pseudomaricurvus alcaniphilus TaxID=1166482 RepID=UPI00140DA390|nr:ISNCY family transposase [Pseudomaricurvus alcaniphilus]NHN39610.1 ISNCY family transposase [Pseudomaricurvus alcaniphilus]
MRHVQPLQCQLGEVEIGNIHFDPQSRDDIPQLLRGLQNLYTDVPARTAVFQLLESVAPEKIDKATGRPGMSLWNILVLGMLRLNLNCDYDRVHELANNHVSLRQMLGHGIRDEDLRYSLQCIKDNVSLLTPAVLDKINQIVVKHAHRELVGEESPLRGRCDSFVVETDVHYPTDINLLSDAIRVIIRLSSRLSERHCLSDWRQHDYQQRQINKLYRKAQKIKHSTSKCGKKREQQKDAIKDAHTAYLTRSEELISKAKFTFKCLPTILDVYSESLVEEIKRFIVHGERQIDQIRRRVIAGECIPHEEKVFSLFEEHTEWISKGKAGVPVELGLKVNIVEDQYGYLLHHQVMENQSDNQVAVSAVQETQARFSNFNVCSFDKGYHSPANQNQLAELLNMVVLPKKGKRGKSDQEREQAEEFVAARRKHSAVESAINALEVHGLDRCPDRGIEGFKRYTAMAILARNLQKLGADLQKRDREEAKKQERQRRKKMKSAS